MEYSVEQIRALAERWLAGETSIAEEALLRRFFAEQTELPADLQPYLPLFGQSAEAAGERSHRKLVLHVEPVAGIEAANLAKRRIMPLIRRIAATAAIAAAVSATIVLFVVPRAAHGGDIVCVVNGVKITDPDQIALYTREALEIASDNLNKPGQTLSAELGGEEVMTYVGEMLNELTNNQ